jgi:3-dehydroquinate synthase
MAPRSIQVAAATGSYPIVIGPGTLSTLAQLLDQAMAGARRMIVTSPIVWQLHGRALAKASTDAPILIPDGERFKNLATVGRVYEELILRGADRAVVIVAVGGGVIGDLVGFAAATYLRGVRLVQVPTTLMAQVDSSIGGKVGVNHPLGKNLIGAFHAPRLVVTDPEVLSTLPRREFRSGLYEVLKYGAIAEPTLLDRVLAEQPALFAHDPDLLASVIGDCCRIKADVVAADEREAGGRRVLNFGHTLGHALEAVTKYRRFRHGEAVAYGMLAALALGVKRRVTKPEIRDRVAQLITRLGPLPPVADLSAAEILAATAHDKKIVSGTLHFVAVTAPGKTTILSDVTTKELKAALRGIGIVRP